MLLVAWGKGLVQGFIVTAPAMLIMKLVGEEGELGIVQSISSLVTALMMYVIGRNLKPNRRLVVYFVAVWLFFIGALTNSLVFNYYSVLFFLLCMIVARPLFDMAYFPIQMQVIDYLSEKRIEVSTLIFSIMNVVCTSEGCSVVALLSYWLFVFLIMQL